MTFVALEGVDGCGKTTQVRLLKERLEAGGRGTLTVREPGGTPVGEAIREILLERHDLDMSGETELLLFLASRVELYENVIGPASRDGQVVISDRYHLSTVVYQGIGRQLGEEKVAALCEQVLGERRPHLNVLVDIPLEECERRMGAERDRMESDPALLARVARGFHETRGLPGDRIVRVDGTGDPETVGDRVWEVVQHVL